MSTDWTYDNATNGHRSSTGWRLVRRPGALDYEWDVLDPDGTVRAVQFRSVTDAQREADRLRFKRTGMTGCPFCEVGPEDDCTMDCLTRGLSARDAAVLAKSREDRIATLTTEAEALREYVRLHP